MKIKTFISLSSHKRFFDLINKLLDHTPAEEKTENELFEELDKQKQALEQIYVQYNGKFDELHRLIAEYQVQQIQIRKKIRQIQLDKKDRKGAVYFFRKGIDIDSSFQGMIYILLHTFLFDDVWLAILEGLDYML